MVNCDEQTPQNHLAMAKMEGDDDVVVVDLAGVVEQPSIMQFNATQTGTYNSGLLL